MLQYSVVTLASGNVTHNFAVCYGGGRVSHTDTATNVNPRKCHTGYVTVFRLKFRGEADSRPQITEAAALLRMQRFHSYALQLAHRQIQPLIAATERSIS